MVKQNKNGCSLNVAIKDREEEQEPTGTAAKENEKRPNCAWK